MDKEKERENFDYFDDHSPERKLELIDGRLIAGNSLAGSQLLFDHVLRGWSVDAAAALGSIKGWVAALCEAYGLQQPAQIDDRALEGLEQQAKYANYIARDLTPGDEGRDAGHRRVRDHINRSLWEVSEALSGQTLGRDFVMRLGEDGFTPDTVFFMNGKLNRFYEYYLSGPAELVIEVTRPAHRNADDRVKREHYSRGGVPEYLIVDPEQRQVQFLRLISGQYVVQPPDADGCYRPKSVPGLAIAAAHMWPEGESFSTREEPNPFIVEQAQPVSPPVSTRMRGIVDGLGWGHLPFVPRLDLQPVRLNFGEYICWSPESKFEFWDGRIQISGREGVRHVTGMLLATLGLVEACRFAPALEWLNGLRRRHTMEARDEQIRREWRGRAAKAAELLREKYDPSRIAVTGDLLSPQPLGFWSRLTLAVSGLLPEALSRAYADLSAMDVDLIEIDREYLQQKSDSGEFALEEI